MTDIFNASKWCSAPTAYWTIQYEYKRNGANMQYRFYWKVWLGSSSGYYNNGLQLQMFLNGSPIVVTVKGRTTTKGWSYDGTTDWYTVSNKTSGTTPFSALLYDTNTYTVEVTSDTYKLSISPCGAEITSAPNFTDEESPTITYSNPAGNNAELLQASVFSGAVALITHDIKEKTGKSYTFNFTDAEKKILRNFCRDGKTAKLAFRIKTEIDGAEFFSTSDDVTLSIVNADPTFTDDLISYEDTNTAIGSLKETPLHIVQNKSTLAVTFGSATANKEATISKYDVTVNGVTKTGTPNEPLDFGTINASSDCEISITVTDSRGNTATAKKPIPITPYTLPVITSHSNYTSIICKRCDEDGEFINSGERLKVIAQGRCNALPNKANTAKMQVKYDNSSWIDIPIESQGNDGNISWYNINAKVDDVELLKTKSYSVTIRCIDSFGEYSDYPQKIPTSKVDFHLRKGVGFGKYCEIENAVEIAEDWDLYVKGMKLEDYIKLFIN